MTAKRKTYGDQFSPVERRSFLRRTHDATYFPFLVHMVITRNCNLSCGYCHEYNKTSLPVSVDQLIRRIDRLKELGTLALTITGGEPLLHPDVLELLGYSRGKFRALGMITNAYLLTEETVAKLNAAGLTSLQISIDGVLPNPVTAKALKPLKNKLDMVARTAKFMVNINSVIGSTLLSELVEVYQFARSHGFSMTAQVIHDHKGQILLPDEDRLARYQVIKTFRNPFWNSAWRGTRNLLVEGKAPFTCRAGCRYLYINELGEVCWCSATQNRFHKPLEEYTTDDLKAQFYLRKGCEDFCTLGCVRAVSVFEWFRRYG